MPIKDWIKKNLEHLKKIVLTVLMKLSRTTIAVIFDKECAICARDSKLDECFLPFLSTPNRIKLFLLIILYGIFYDQIRQAGLEGMITAEIWKEIVSLHAEFKEWKNENCLEKTGG